MNVNHGQDEKFVLCFSDLLALFKRSRLKIALWACTLGLLGVMFALLNPIRYESEGTFREKSAKSGNISTGGSVLQLLSQGGISGGGSENEAYSLIKSRKLLKDVIDKHCLQANLEAQSDKEGLFTTIKNNFLVMKAVLKNSPKPVLKELCCPLKIVALNYPGEVSYSFLIDVQEDAHFKVMSKDDPDTIIGEGILGVPFQFDELSITLDQADPDKTLIAQRFSLDVKPLCEIVKKMSNVLEIEPSKNDKSLLKITFNHRDRFLTSELINSVMESYQNYLKDHHSNISLKQLDYLNLRRDHLTLNLQRLMNRHADYLSNDLYSAGFIDSEKEMNFLAMNQHEYKEKLLANELEIKRLENLTPGNVAYYDRYSIREGDPAVINHILSEIRKLKQLRDNFEIELQKKSFDHVNNLQQSFEKQITELTTVQLYLGELGDLTKSFQANTAPNPNSKLLNDHRFLLKGWFERLENARLSDPTNYKKIQENFQFYLSNLERLFGVHEHVLQERLTHQQNPSGEYQGITLDVATELYLDYSKNMILLEGSVRQNLFFIHQIEDPNFEITSLSGDLTDQVSRDMIRRASELVLNLRDSNNQSIKEQERIKDELNLQRTFLAMHLQQMIQLMELNKDLIDEKIYALQNVSLGLIHQQISLLEKNLQDYVQSRLHNLQQERSLIKQHLETIHLELAALPEKWVSEQLIEQEVDTNKLIVEEIAKMVESKNISHNLEVIQSAPLDTAIPALHPAPPKVFFWGLMGILLGGFIGSAVALGKGISNGLPVSEANLKEMGFHVSGSLSSPLYGMNKQLFSHNLATLRRLQVYMDTPIENQKKWDSGKCILLIEGDGLDCAPGLADLYTQRGLHVLTIDIDFSALKEQKAPGLLNYLKGEITSLPIQQGPFGDMIFAGGVTPFGIEFIGSSAFKRLLKELEEKYDKILVVAGSRSTSAEAESLIPLFSCIAINVCDETIDELQTLHTYTEKNSWAKISFLLSSLDGEKWKP